MRKPCTKRPTPNAAAAIGLLVLAGSCAPAWASQPLITDDTGTQGSGGNQLEFALSHDHTEVGGMVEHLRTLPITYTRGLSDTLDISAGISHAWIHSSTGGDSGGNGNPSLGAKWRVYDDTQAGTSFAVKPEILFPVSSGRESAGLGTGRTSGGLTLILTQELPFGAVHFNAGVARERYRNAADNPDTTIVRASLAPVWDLAQKWKLALDVGTETAHAAGTSVRSNFVEIGAIWSPNNDLDFALGLVHTTDNNFPGATTRTAMAGLTWRYR